MNIRRMKIYAVTLLATLFACAVVQASAESLNPEGVNPHQVAPRKKITQEQKNAAWEAKKKKKAEIEARKAAQKAAQPYDLQKMSDGETGRKP